MTKGFRIALATAAVAAGVAFAGASPAQAQVEFSGSFPLPHGRISIGIGAPEWAIGTYVPNGYDVYCGDDGAYGFEYEDRWIPVRQYSDRWVVCEPSQAYGYGGGYAHYGYSGYNRYYGHNVSRYNAWPSYGYRHGYRQDYRSRDHGRVEGRGYRDGYRDGYRH